MATKNVVREDVVQISFETEYRELIKAHKEANEFKNEMSSGMKETTNDVRKGTGKINQEFKSVQTELKDTAKQSGKMSKDFKGDLKEMRSEADKLESSLGDLGGVVGAIGVGAAAASVVGTASNQQQSGNKLQAMTGSSGDELDEMKKSMQEIYKNNMGESFEDIAVSMASVKNQTDLSGKALETMTSNALLLRDVFGFEVNESVRSADMMMEQFGISGERAFDLLAQGAQMGLDKNGNLLDTMNEYSVHFKQIGFGAEDMMSMFGAAAEKGVFDIDKIGDAVKEFGIRAVDGSETTSKGFEAIGLDADKMAQKFKAGGESGKQAFQETVTALNAMKDPVAREAAGVALFGTMWEDLGAEAVLAMGNVKNEVTAGTQALDEINKVTYDSAWSALQALGRGINIELAGPINAMLPYAQKALGFISDHLNIILPLLATFGALMGLGAIATNGMAIAQGIMNGLMVAFKPIMLAAKGVQLLFNTALYGCPLFWIVAGVVAVIAIVVLLVKHWDTVKSTLLGVWNALKAGVTVMKNKFIETFNSMKAGISAIVAGIKSTIESKIKAVVEFFSGLKTTLFNKGVDMITGFVNGIKSMLGKVKKVAESIGDKVKAGLSWFKFGSPSKRMKQYGGWAVEGFGGGAEDESKGLRKTVKDNVTNPVRRLTGQTIMHGSSDYVPNQSVSHNKTSNNETNNYSPQFNLTVSASGDRDTERKVKKWVKEAMNETFESMNRRNGQLTEV